MNILWITCDEMRWDALPCHGNRLTSMPASERLAAEGTVFEHAYCQMPKCVPSRCSMLTGRYPHVDGFRTLRGRKNPPDYPETASNDLLALHADTPNLIPLVRNAGYKTCLLGKNHVVEWNLHKQWFDQTPSWDFDRIPVTETRPEYLRAKYSGDLAEDFDMSRHCDSVTADETIEFLRKCKGQPFFALVDMSFPHPGYHTINSMPSAKLPLETFDPPPVADLEKTPFVERAMRLSKNLEAFDDNDRRYIRRAYYSMCEFADRQVARILDRLDELGLSEDTMVIYTSDHGDFAGDHNCFEKWDTSFLDCIVRIPLIIRLPGKIPAGYRTSSMVELIDIFPTILEGMKLPLPSYTQGRSLWPLMQKKTPIDWRTSVLCQGGVEYDLTRRAVHAEKSGTDPVKQQVLLDFPDSMGRARMLRNHQYKYIHRLHGGHELYDMQNDPCELTNLIENNELALVVQTMRCQLLDRLMEAESTLPEVTELYA